MTNEIEISISCVDRTGLIAAVSGYIFDAGGNLGLTSFVAVAGQARFRAVSSFQSAIDTENLTSGMAALPLLAGAEISVQPLQAGSSDAPPDDITHEIIIGGGDQPGIIARICEAIVEHDANIVRLSSEPDGRGNYEIWIAVNIPADRAAVCLATISNTAEGLQLNCRIKNH